MQNPKPARLWLETALAAVTGLLFVLTAAWPDWIEAVFGWDPDHHSGWLEWGIVLALFAATVLTTRVAYIAWRRHGALTA